MEQCSNQGRHFSELLERGFCGGLGTACKTGVYKRSTKPGFQNSENPVWRLEKAPVLGRKSD